MRPWSQKVLTGLATLPNLSSCRDAIAAGLSQAWLVGLMAGPLSGSAAIDSLQPPAVVDIVLTIDNKANITTQDY